MRGSGSPRADPRKRSLISRPVQLCLARGCGAPKFEMSARVGAAQALLQLGERERARGVAKAELADVKVFGAPRALGIALRVAGLAHGGSKGIDLLGDSVASLRKSPAVLERAHSLAELGAALRRNGCRSAAREPLSEALDLAARCGARSLVARARRTQSHRRAPTARMAHWPGSVKSQRTACRAAGG